MAGLEGLIHDTVASMSDEAERRVAMGRLARLAHERDVTLRDLDDILAGTKLAAVLAEVKAAILDALPMHDLRRYGDKYVVEPGSEDEVVAHGGVRNWRSLSGEFELGLLKDRKIKDIRPLLDSVAEDDESWGGVAVMLDLLLQDLVRDGYGSCLDRAFFDQLAELRRAVTFVSEALDGEFEVVPRRGNINGEATFGNFLAARMNDLYELDAGRSMKNGFWFPIVKLNLPDTDEVLTIGITILRPKDVDVDRMFEGDPTNNLEGRYSASLYGKRSCGRMSLPRTTASAKANSTIAGKVPFMLSEQGTEDVAIEQDGLWIGVDAVVSKRDADDGLNGSEPYDPAANLMETLINDYFPAYAIASSDAFEDNDCFPPYARESDTFQDIVACLRQIVLIVDNVMMAEGDLVHKNPAGTIANILANFEKYFEMKASERYGVVGFDIASFEVPGSRKRTATLKLQIVPPNRALEWKSRGKSDLYVSPIAGGLSYDFEGCRNDVWGRDRGLLKFDSLDRVKFGKVPDLFVAFVVEVK